jgi:hypothetical protein
MLAYLFAGDEDIRTRVITTIQNGAFAYVVYREYKGLKDVS